MNWAVILFLSFVWSATLSPFTAMHTYQIITNQTTLEYLKNQNDMKRRKRANLSANTTTNQWDVGYCANWRAVMGKRWLLWLSNITY